MSRPPLPKLAAIATAVPPHVVRQNDARGLVAQLFSGQLAGNRRLLDVFENAHIEQRHVCAPLEWFAEDHSFAEKNARYVDYAVRLASEAVTKALQRAHLVPSDVDHIVFVSSTGLATPSIDALLANALGFRADIRRTPIWGLGCAGGAAGISHTRDLCLARPTARVVLVALELCSLTFQRGDLSKRNLVASSLFGDGAAAAVVLGGATAGAEPNGRPGLELVASRSVLWRDTVDVMGWTVDGDGLHVVFSRDIPTIVRERVRPSLTAFLDSCGVGLDVLEHVVAHPGGAKVLNAYAETLGLGEGALAHAREVLRCYGNMSSPSCLFVLERFLDTGTIRPGDRALIAALGPGFSAEYVLTRAVGSD